MSLHICDESYEATCIHIWTALVRRWRKVKFGPTYGRRGLTPISRKRFLTVWALILGLWVPAVVPDVTCAGLNRLRRWIWTSEICQCSYMIINVTTLTLSSICPCSCAGYISYKDRPTSFYFTGLLHSMNVCRAATLFYQLSFSLSRSQLWLKLGQCCAYLEGGFCIACKIPLTCYVLAFVYVSLFDCVLASFRPGIIS